MKKICLSLIATLTISTVGFANTIEIKDLEKLEVVSSSTKILDKEEEEALRICYLMSTDVSEPVPGIIKTVKTYMCFDHPNTLGNGTVYVGN